MIVTVNRKQREALEFLYHRLKDDETKQKYNKVKPITWRHGAQGRFYHTLRVLHHARNISRHLMCDQEVVEMAVILHDIAKIADYENHADKGAKIAKYYLEGQQYAASFIEQVSHCIRQHNMKGKTPYEPLEVRILQDADLLDKKCIQTVKKLIGCLSKGQKFKKEIIETLKKDHVEKLYSYKEKANFPFVRQEIENTADTLTTWIKDLKGK